MDNRGQTEGQGRCPQCGERVERGKQHRCKSGHHSGNGGGKTAGKPTASEDAIRQRAYELYVQRGRTPGHDVQDWIQAEHELAGGRR